MDRLDDAAHEIEMTGKGMDVRGKGSASMKMTGRVTALPDGGSEVVTVSEVNVVGILAQFGGRMIQEVSGLMFGEFTKRFRQKLESGDQPTEEMPAVTEPVNAVKLGAAAIGGTVKKLFGRLLRNQVKAGEISDIADVVRGFGEQGYVLDHSLATAVYPAHPSRQAAADRGPRRGGQDGSGPRAGGLSGHGADPAAVL